MTRNRVIGRGGSLPWDLPDEMAHFKRTTLGQPVIMGRRTFESGAHPLPGRHSIVLSRRGIRAPAGVDVAKDLDEALSLAGQGGKRDCFVIGGTEPFAAALPRAHRLIATVIDAELDGDTAFPDFNPCPWRLVECIHHPADGRHAYAFDIRTFVRGIPQGPPL